MIIEVKQILYNIIIDAADGMKRIF